MKHDSRFMHCMSRDRVVDRLKHGGYEIGRVARFRAKERRLMIHATFLPQISRLQLHIPIMVIDEPIIFRTQKDSRLPANPTRVQIPYAQHSKDHDAPRLQRLPTSRQRVRVNVGTGKLDMVVQSCGGAVMRL